MRTQASLLIRLLFTGFVLILLSGCASYGIVQNTAMPDTKPAKEYSVRSFAGAENNEDLTMFLSFSGGGTRAAALAYGVMLELRDTNVNINGKTTRLLDEVDTISSVSGGSFTSAYYGLHGDGLFETFEDVFLRYDIEKHLVRSTLNPFHWFSRKGRTERALEYYNEKIFHGATYADMHQPGRPLIVINATDLAWGIRFSFVQDYFDLLCSELNSFPVARAVTASSAVPVVFNPVAVENYSDCDNVNLDWVGRLREAADRQDSMELTNLADDMESYTDKTRRKYIHFVDGGITDNMGLRAFYDVLSANGGSKAFLDRYHREAPSNMVIIAIDASTKKIDEMDTTLKAPSMAHSMNAVTDVQLHRYNTATIELVDDTFKRWAKEVSTPEKTVEPHFIELSFSHLEKPQVRQFFNKVPTSFSLTDEQVDRLIDAGRTLLRENPKFQHLLTRLNQ